MPTLFYEVASGEIRPFPVATTLTGTVVSSTTVVTGTGTSFLSELLISGGPGLKHKYLFNSTTGEIRSIARVDSDTVLHLNTAFAVADLAGENLEVLGSPGGRKVHIDVVGDNIGETATFHQVDQAALTIEATIPTVIGDGRGLPPFCLQCNGGFHAHVAFEQ